MLNIGITEVQDVCILVFIITGAMGQDFWLQPIFDGKAVMFMLPLYPLWFVSLSVFISLGIPGLLAAKNKLYALA